MTGNERVVTACAVVVLVVLGVAIGLLLHQRADSRPGPLWDTDGGARPLMPPGGLP